MQSSCTAGIRVGAQNNLWLACFQVLAFYCIEIPEQNEISKTCNSPSLKYWLPRIFIIMGYTWQKRFILARSTAYIRHSTTKQKSLMSFLAHSDSNIMSEQYMRAERRKNNTAWKMSLLQYTCFGKNAQLVQEHELTNSYTIFVLEKPQNLHL